jgi:DNA-binding CsgD family transcriptional regulator
MRLARWASLHPVTIDAALAGAFCAGALLLALGEGIDPSGGPVRRLDTLGGLLIAGMTLPLAARRLLPRAVAVVTVGCTVAAVSLGFPVGLGPFAALFALGSLAYTTSRRDTLLVGSAAGVALLAGFVAAPGPAGSANYFGNLLAVAATLVAGHLLRLAGTRTRSWRSATRAGGDQAPCRPGRRAPHRRHRRDHLRPRRLRLRRAAGRRGRLPAQGRVTRDPARRDPRRGQGAGPHRARGDAEADRPLRRHHPDPARSRELDKLSEREREVLLEVAHGRSNGQIARRLFIEEATVKSHVSSILLKLGLRSRVQAVIHAYETGLVSPGTPTRPSADVGES